MFSKGLKVFSSTTLLVVLAAVMAWGPVASASEPFIGTIQMFGFNFAPRGWALCDGQLLPIAQNTALFSLLGTTYGGDGRTTFALPDLRGRVAIHQGTGPGLTNRRIGQNGGTERISISQMPEHTHIAKGFSGSGNQEGPGGNTWAQKNRDDDYSDQLPNVEMNPNAIQDTGGNSEHMPPYLVVNHCIALVGLFPSRN